MELKFIKEHKKKTITIDEIKQHITYTSQKELYNIIGEYINKKILEPFGKDVTYESPSVHKKYKIVPEDCSEILKEIDGFQLLNMKYYKQNPKEFINHKPYLIAIKKYFTNALHTDTTLSLNERSLLIFKDEKFLSSKLGLKIISNIGLTQDSFNIYHTPEIFMYYKNNTKSGNVLIIENKDTWTTFKRNLISHKNVFGKNFDAIIYGEGRKILSSFQFIQDEEFSDFNSVNNKFYYFGDIDSSGISIMYSLMKKYDKYNITPFMDGYNILFNNIEQYGHMKYHDDLTEKNDNNVSIDAIKECFTNINAEDLYNFCKQGKIIPQEVVNNDILMKGSKKC